MAKLKKFPERLFITQEQFSDESGMFFTASEDEIEACERDHEGDDVATYQLVKVEKLELVKTTKVVKK